MTDAPEGPLRPPIIAAALHMGAECSAKPEQPCAMRKRCAECNHECTGILYMFSDMPFCCQRHRSAAFYRTELYCAAQSGLALRSTPPDDVPEAAYQRSVALQARGVACSTPSASPSASTRGCG